MTKNQLREHVDNWFHTAVMETPGDIGEDARQALREILALLADEPKAECRCDTLPNEGPCLVDAQGNVHVSACPVAARLAEKARPEPKAPLCDGRDHRECFNGVCVWSDLMGSKQKTERVCPDSADGNHVLKQDGPFSVVYCDACGMNRGFRGDENRTGD